MRGKSFHSDKQNTIFLSDCLLFCSMRIISTFTTFTHFIHIIAFQMQQKSQLVVVSNSDTSEAKFNNLAEESPHPVIQRKNTQNIPMRLSCILFSKPIKYATFNFPKFTVPFQVTPQIQWNSKPTLLIPKISYLMKYMTS
jgi:hypothetical protein